MSFSQANDIKEFKIEGMAIGDSLLNYFNESEIQNNIHSDYPASDRFKRFYAHNHKSFELYEGVQINFKKNDKKYIIHVIAGQINFPDNINACLKEQKKVVKELDSLFPNAEKWEHQQKKKFDKSGKSISYIVAYVYKKNKKEWHVGVTCDDWSKDINKKHNMQDNLAVSIRSHNAVQFLRHEAYE